MDLFGTAGIRGPVRDRVTPERALSVGHALGRYIRSVERKAPAVVVGWDGRETSHSLAAAVEAGLTSAGVDVRRVGELPTPALAYCSQDRYGVMITASHNPPTDNGIKLFDDGEEFDSSAEGEIERLLADTDEPTAWNEFGTSGRADELGTYRDRIIEYAVTTLGGAHDEPLSGVSVVVDCGNGVSSVATPQVLRALGAHVVTLNANVDGTFPGRESKPTPETLTDLRAFLRDGEFDLGIGHDGDGDRIVIVGPDGDVVHEDTILAVLARQYVAESDSDDPVVITTPNASARIDQALREAGGRTERVRLGALHEGIARERRQGETDTEVVFAAEPWKHIHPAFGGWIDGVVSAAAVAVLVADAGDTATLREPITERPYRKVSVDCPDDAKADVMATLETDLPERFPDATVDTEYGIRLTFPDASWLLVRPSGTEPYVRLYAESDDVDELVASARSIVDDVVSERR